VAKEGGSADPTDHGIVACTRSDDISEMMVSSLGSRIREMMVSSLESQRWEKMGDRQERLARKLAPCCVHVGYEPSARPNARRSARPPSEPTAVSDGFPGVLHAPNESSSCQG